MSAFLPFRVALFHIALSQVPLVGAENGDTLMRRDAIVGPHEQAGTEPLALEKAKNDGKNSGFINVGVSDHFRRFQNFLAPRDHSDIYA